MLTTVRKAFDLAGRDQRGRWFILVLGAALATGLEMVGAILIFVLLALLADPEGNVDVPVVGNLREQFAGVDETTFLLGAAAILAAFFITRAVGQVLLAYVKNRVAHNAAARLSAILAEGYLRLPYAYHLRRSSSELIRNAHQTVEELAGQCFVPIIHILAEGLLILGLLATLAVVAPIGTLIALPVVGGAAAVLLRVVQPRLKELGIETQEMRWRSLASLQQSLHGIRDIKILGTEAHFGNLYRKDRERLARTHYLRTTMSEMPRHVIETALVGFILLLFTASILLDVNREELLSTLGLFAYAGMRMLPSLQKIVRGLNDLRYKGPAVDQVHDDWSAIHEFEAAEEEGPIAPLDFDNEIQLRGVSFAYGEGDHPDIGDVNLSIKRGEVVGICGPTGGGKTTLTDVITGILEPTSGTVTVDGADVRTHRRAWFQKLGVVPQMVFVVDDTVRRNVALGIPDEEIDEEAVWEAIRLAQLQGFVDRLPDGLDTRVGERGVRVSGGERQRLVIARALYRRPEVLVFDEGTSALDNNTEAVLMSSLEKLRGGHTILLVAHRLSTVQNCDKIVYLEGGRVQAIGEYTELQAKSAGFRALVESSEARTSL